MEEGGSTVGRGALVTETSAELVEMLRGRFRTAAVLCIVAGVFLAIIGVVLWMWVGVAWWLYIAFFAGTAFLLLFGLMFLLVCLGVPRLKVYEGGVLMRVPRGGTVFHPWEDFSGYRERDLRGMRVLELHRTGEGVEPITIHGHVGRYSDVVDLVGSNVPPME